MAAGAGMVSVFLLRRGPGGKRTKARAGGESFVGGAFAVKPKIRSQGMAGRRDAHEPQTAKSACFRGSGLGNLRDFVATADFRLK
jgi:hypothetical protein